MIFTFFAVVALNVADAASVAGGPMSKVFEMLSDLQAKILKEGKESQQVYDEFSEWCKDRSRNVGFEIKTGKSEAADLSAAIEKESANMAAFSTKIEELAGSISKNEADLKEATEMRASEAADFAAEERESVEVIATLERAINVLSREMAKGSASMVQLKGAEDIAQAMNAMVHASVLSSADASRLTALLQDSQTSEESSSDENQGGHGDGVVSTLENLLDKAQEQLDSARKTEATNSHNFAMLKQSLEDEIDALEKDMDDTKKSTATSEEAKSIAEGDLSVTSVDLQEDVDTLRTVKQDCMTGAEDFRAGTKSRSDELTALAQAKKALGEALPAAAQTYGAALEQAMFLQVSESSKTSRADQVQFEAVRLIRTLARKENSVELAQLASRMNSVIRFGGSTGGDPFSKVKSLISDMISKIEKDTQADASHKGFCDKETSETNSKKDDKSHEISKLSTKIDSSTAKSGKLKEAISSLQGELQELASAQALMETIRSEEKSIFEKNEAEMKAGIGGIQKALIILREYYAQESEGGGNKIISLLEVVESDLTKGMSEMQVAESTAGTDYEKTSYMNKVAKTSKIKDREYKAAEAAGLAKTGAEASSDKDGVQAELDALHQYLAKLGEMCIAKAEPFAERRARRQAEIAGLKQALAVIDGEAVLLQKSSARRVLRGSRT